MPDIWDDKKFLTTYRVVLGTMANYAIQQSPYPIPDNLAAALREFDTIFKGTILEEMKDTGVIATSYQRLVADVRMCINMCPLILAWNIPLKGGSSMAFVSRYTRPDPDYDFVDLDALANNVAMSITLVEKYDNEYGAGMAGVNEAETSRV
jgi:hypothetical protein